jgi:DNA-binding CsgD family transcriptional regulator
VSLGITTDEAWLTPVALALYGAATGEGDLAAALDGCLDALSADTAFAYTARLEDGTRRDTLLRGAGDPAMVEAYSAQWARLNGRTRGWPEVPDGTVIDFDAVVPPPVFARSDVWLGFLRHHLPMLHAIGLAVSVAPGLQARFGFGRTPASGPFPEGAKARLAALAPHLRRAAVARMQAVTRAAAQPLASEAFGAVTLAAARYGRDGRFLGANAALHALAARRDGFTLGPAGIEPVRPGDRAALAEAIRGGGARLLPLGRRGAAVPYLAEVIATPGQQVLVVVKDPASPLAARAEDLAAMFGLTEAQARLARDIAAGMTLAAHAAAEAIPAETARSRLKAVLARTGCRRQADLAALIARLPDGA